MVSNTQMDFSKNQQFKEDLRKLLDYVYYDEKKDYMCYPSRRHIYLVIRRLAKCIRYVG